jgi:ABC-2 type transport system ATP-binding protein
MEEAERLCNRVAILDRGKIIAMDTPKGLKDTLKGDVIVVRIKNPEELANKFQGVDFVKDLKILDERIVFLVENGENAIPKIVALANGNKIESIELHHPTLNDVFLHYTGREIKDASQMKSRGRKRWVS